MNADEVNIITHCIHGVWGVELSSDEVAVWGRLLTSWDVDVCLLAIDRLSEASPRYAPRAPELIHMARRIIAERAAAMPPANHCDGSGWISFDEGELRPCDACNPYLAAIFKDPVQWDRYLDGTPLFNLHDDVREKDRRPVADTMPPPCRVERWHDPAETVVPPALGLQVARRAYIEERESQGLPVNTMYFDDQIRRALERDYEE